MEVKKYKHNVEALRKIKKCIKNKKTFLCSNCTGSGKSYLIKETAKVVEKPLLVTRDKRIISDIDIPVITYCKFSRGNTVKIINSKYKSIIFDEAHHLGAKGCKKNLTKIKIPIYGFTATPIRMDGINVANEFFDTHINTITLEDAWKEKIFEPPDYIVTTLHKNKEKGIRYIPIAEKSVNRTFDKYIKNKKKILVFCTNNKDMEYFYDALHEKFESLGFKCSMYSMHHNNNKMFDDFRFNHKEKQVLFSIDKLIEGFHIENVDCILIYRNTKSIRILNQILGRICDLNKNVKPCVIDFLSNINILYSNLSSNRIGFSIKRLLRCDRKEKMIIEIDYDEVEFKLPRERPFLFNDKKVELRNFCVKNNLNYDTFYGFLKRKKTHKIDENLIACYKKRTVPKRYNYFFDGKIVPVMKYFCEEHGIKNSEGFCVFLMRRYKDSKDLIITNELIKMYKKELPTNRDICLSKGITNYKSFGDWCLRKKCKTNDPDAMDRYLKDYAAYEIKWNAINNAKVKLKNIGRDWNGFKHWAERKKLVIKKDYSNLDQFLNEYINTHMDKNTCRVWMNNGINEKQTIESKKQQYLNDGWIEGRLIKGEK